MAILRQLRADNSSGFAPINIEVLTRAYSLEHESLAPHIGIKRVIEDSRAALADVGRL